MQLFPSTIPAATPANPAGGVSGIATATRHQLSNGIVVLIQRNPSNPTVRVRGEVRVGAINEPATHAGLAVFTGAALIRGTPNRTFQQISAETEERGCSVSSGGGQHSSGFSGKALVEDLPLVLEVLADIVINPTFPPDEIARLRGQFLMSLRENEQDTRTQASRAARALLYPEGHPYSRLSSGTIETVQTITRDDLVAFHQQYHPAATTIAVVGDVEPAAVIAELERTFGVWESAATPAVQELPPVPPLSGMQRRDVDVPGKVQSDVIWSVHGLARSDPDYYPAMMGNMILGRLGMGGRLGENVRENQGMAYYVYSGLEADLGAGPWAAVAGISPDNVERAIQAILQEIEQFKHEGPTDEELADAKAYLTGSLVLGLETNDGIAGTLLAIERYGLGLDYIDRYPDIINGLSHEDIVTVARKYLSTENCVVVVAGPL
ncbi:MAG: M16 family metallopeptidase [Chloroflexaceae bacterium]